MHHVLYNIGVKVIVKKLYNPTISDFLFCFMENH
jgi:hypothetical protein